MITMTLYNKFLSDIIDINTTMAKNRSSGKFEDYGLGRSLVWKLQLKRII